MSGRVRATSPRMTFLQGVTAVSCQELVTAMVAQGQCQGEILTRLAGRWPRGTIAAAEWLARKRKFARRRAARAAAATDRPHV